VLSECKEEYQSVPAALNKLGILPKLEEMFTNSEDTEWARSDIAEQTVSEKFNDSTAIDIENPAPYEQENSVVFICVDVEAYEHDHSRITEVGIATLDTADINTMSPGKGGINWIKSIRARHFRIREHGHLKNQKFINGCAEHFQFGLDCLFRVEDRKS
jgi:hypothetical protein